MPATVRDILLLIRAKEDASRTINKLSGNMRSAAAAADAASARARAAALRAQAQQMRLAGASKTQIDALHRQAKAYDDEAKSIERSTKKSKEMAASLGDIGSTMQTAGLVMLGASAGLAFGLKQAVDTAAEWDKQVRLTFTQVDRRFKPSLEQLSDIGLRVSRNIAVPFETIQGALFDVFSSTEANMPQAEKLLTSFAKAAVAGQTDIQVASRATIGLMNAFKLPFTDVNKLLDIQFQLVQEGVGTYEEWANRIGLVSPSAVRAGQSIETMAAALSTATRLGQNAARASTSVARAFDAMSNPKTEKHLHALGIATRDARGQFRPMVDVLADWKKQIDKLPEKDKVAEILDVLKGAGGTIEARRFLQQILMSKGGLELFQAQIKEFATDKGAFTSAYNEMAGSVASKTVLLHNAWMTLKQSIGAALMPMFSQLVGWLQKLADWFNKLPASTKQTIAQVGALATVLLAGGGAVAVIAGALVSLVGIVAMAGEALVPMIATFVGIAAAGTAVVAMVAGVVAAFIRAYQASAPLRATIAAIWGAFQDLWMIAKNFAVNLVGTVTNSLRPALMAIWSAIQTYVLPAVITFVNWFRTQVVPAISQVADGVNNVLGPVLKWLANTIRANVVPMIQQMTDWWNKHQNVIRPVVKWLAIIGAALLGLAVGGPIVAVIAAIAALVAIIRVLWTVGTKVFNAIVATIHWVAGAFSAAFNWISNTIGSWKLKTAQSIVAVITFFRQLPGKIRAIFSGAGTWLASAGSQIVSGLINGIRGMVGAAANAAANLARQVKDAAMSALGIHSPSKVFKDIGMDTIRGFIQGVQNSTTLKQLQNAMYKVTRDVQRSISGVDPKKVSKRAKAAMSAKWNVRLASTTAKLNKLENLRVATQTKLAAAQKSVNDQLAVRNDLASKITDSLMKGTDITSLNDDEKKSSTTIKQGLQDRLKALQAFQTNLRNLAKRGFDKQALADLAQQGVDQAGAVVSAIAAGSQQDLQQISKLEQQIRGTATDTGTKVAGDLYNAGIAAGQGLVKGLQSQLGNITKQMTAIANALVKAIKKELGIHSPSKVFGQLGVNTARGYVNSYIDHMNRKRASMVGATRFTPDAYGANGRVGFGGDNSGMFNTGPSKVVNNNITVNTREIDPRKTSADLGWELAGRV